MGWFESQIEERERSDAAKLEASLRALCDAVTGKDTSSGVDMVAQASSALAAVLGYYGAKPAEPPRGMEDLGELIEFQLRSTGVMHRAVRLPKGWTDDAIGALLGFLQDGTPVALLPQKRGGYAYRSPEDGSYVRIDRAVAATLKDEAYCFYRPLPQKELGVRDILLYLARSLDSSDYVAIVLATLAATLLGMVVPTVNAIVFGPVVEWQDRHYRADRGAAGGRHVRAGGHWRYQVARHDARGHAARSAGAGGRHDARAVTARVIFRSIPDR